MEKKKRICQIGAGLIGKERISATMNLVNLGKNVEIIGVYDPYIKEDSDILKKHNLHKVDSLEEIYSLKPDWVFISTPHDISLNIASDMLKHGFKVLVEKPLGRDLKETKKVLAKQIKANQIFVGYNYRFYEGIRAMLADFKKGLFGKIISVNMILGHGGSPADKDSWKLDPEKAGGGVLIDPGIHLLDICKCMFRDKIEVKEALTWKGFWNTGIEEEAHVLLKSGKSIINIGLSVVKWRSTFRIEVNGDKGYGIVEGRGRSYGLQRYVRGERWGWMSGKPQKDTEIMVAETDGNDSFQKEIDSLLFENEKDTVMPCKGKEALESMKLLELCRRKAGLINN